MHAFNAAAVQLFGYEAAEVVNKVCYLNRLVLWVSQFAAQNVAMLMNDKDAAAHDSYLARHMSTGENRIVGKFRAVQCKHKSGKLFEATLSVSKSVDPDDANVVYFTGNIVLSKK